MAAMAPLEVQMGDVNAQNLGQLRTLNEHTFPVRYADKFYDEIPTLPEGLARFAYCGGTDCGVPWPSLMETPSTRRASIRRGRGWFCFRF